MKEFILIVRMPVTYTQQTKEAHENWARVVQKWKADNIFVISFSFPSEGYVLSGAEITVNKEWVISNNLRVVSYIVLLATDIEAAVELAKASPIFDLGGTIEVREAQPRLNQPNN